MASAHVKQVKSLYKRSLRLLESWYDQRYIFRYQAVLMRERFDKNRNVVDSREADKLIQEGERQLFLKQHPQPYKFANSPGGVAYEREVEPPDWILDYWHPLEKAQYPEYFKRREERKKEYLANWDKTYGKGAADHHH